MINIQVGASINKPRQEVWELYTNPKHIVNWNFASADWHCPSATNDLSVGGKLSARMEAKDGSFGFDFEGIYDDIKTHELLSYTMSDGRKVTVSFSEEAGVTQIQTNFDAEEENSAEMQKQGWQAIIDNFKNYAENQK